jgi:hypothetical protein
VKTQEEIEKLAEHYWEGCDGCDANDKYFFVKGFSCAYRQLKEDMANNYLNDLKVIADKVWDGEITDKQELNNYINLLKKQN